ncbi:uncharacterized protein LOC123883617 isoform X2 [Trifolium pratense]|uniref:uncharacterized protein LOC123883617 isoform X2 n=1 Tax=Trifolium pratense TaxID=57577 RepID=UPI001E690B1A|nr:uncharacterized protein LOC123883617 isoform X2 [Trifolium pratense]
MKMTKPLNIWLSFKIQIPRVFISFPRFIDRPLACSSSSNNTVSPLNQNSPIEFQPPPHNEEAPPPPPLLLSDKTTFLKRKRILLVLSSRFIFLSRLSPGNAATASSSPRIPCFPKSLYEGLKEY